MSTVMETRSYTVVVTACTREPRPGSAESRFAFGAVMQLVALQTDVFLVEYSAFTLRMILSLGNVSVIVFFFFFFFFFFLISRVHDSRIRQRQRLSSNEARDGTKVAVEMNFSSLYFQSKIPETGGESFTLDFMERENLFQRSAS